MRAAAAAVSSRSSMSFSLTAAVLLVLAKVPLLLLLLVLVAVPQNGSLAFVVPSRRRGSILPLFWRTQQQQQQQQQCGVMQRQQQQQPRDDTTVRMASASSTSTSTSTAAEESLLQSVCDGLEQCIAACSKDVVKVKKVKVGPVPRNKRLGLIATEPIRKGDAALTIPYDDRFVITAETARAAFREVLPETYDGWTGDAGLIALQILAQVAAAADSDKSSNNSNRPDKIQAFVRAWMLSLPGPADMLHHPLLWCEEDQEMLQHSSATKIYRRLDDLEEDVSWLEEHVFSKDKRQFPETVRWNGRDIPCFSVAGYKWAVAVALSRSVFLDGTLRLIPVLDMCNHAEEDAEEIRGTTVGAFGTRAGGQLVAGRDYAAGEEVFCSYGPKSAADYVFEHGFCPERSWRTAVSELTFEVDSADRFYDDKLDILEYETYDAAPMDPVQSFDVAAGPGPGAAAGEPDPAMIQFVRLCQLNGTDAFLLESIFRKEVWGFMELPVSETNERAVVDAITDACRTALDGLVLPPASSDDNDEDNAKDSDDAAASSVDDTGSTTTAAAEICRKLRESETKALARTIEYLDREREALDLKEYYQERRLKDMGLDSEWSPEDDMMSGNDPDLGYGQTRAPGGADYDW